MSTALVSNYKQVELRTGEIRDVQTPQPCTEAEMLQLVNSLNREALTYGCFYFWSAA